MKRHVLAVALALCPVLPLVAQEVGTASGKGTMDRSVPGSKAVALDAAYETVSFSPRFSFASREGKGADAATWIVLTEKQPPVKEWLAAEGLNVANGLESIVVKFQTQDVKRLKATLRTGQGNCSKSDGPQVYCKST